MQRQAVERFGRDLGAGLFGLLARPLEHFLRVSSGSHRASAISAPAAGSSASSRPIAANREGALRELEQLFDADANPLLERLGRIFQPLRQLVSEVLQSRVVPELAVLTASEGLAKRFDVVQFQEKDRGVGEDSLRAVPRPVPDLRANPSDQKVPAIR